MEAPIEDIKDTKNDGTIDSPMEIAEEGARASHNGSEGSFKEKCNEKQQESVANIVEEFCIKRTEDETIMAEIPKETVENSINKTFDDPTVNINNNKTIEETTITNEDTKKNIIEDVGVYKNPDCNKTTDRDSLEVINESSKKKTVPSLVLPKDFQIPTENSIVKTSMGLTEDFNVENCKEVINAGSEVKETPTEVTVVQANNITIKTTLELVNKLEKSVEKDTNGDIVMKKSMNSSLPVVQNVEDTTIEVVEDSNEKISKGPTEVTVEDSKNITVNAPFQVIKDYLKPFESGAKESITDESIKSAVEVIENPKEEHLQIPMEVEEDTTESIAVKPNSADSKDNSMQTPMDVTEDVIQEMMVTSTNASLQDEKNKTPIEVIENSPESFKKETKEKITQQKSIELPIEVIEDAQESIEKETTESPVERKSIELPIEVIEDAQESVEKETIEKTVEQKSIELPIEVIEDAQESFEKVTIENPVEQKSIELIQAIEDAQESVEKETIENPVEQKSIESPIQVIEDAQESVEKETIENPVEQKSIELPVQVIDDAQEPVEKNTIENLFQKKSIESPIQVIEDPQESVEKETIENPVEKTSIESPIQVIEDSQEFVEKETIENLVEQTSIELPIQVIDDAQEPVEKETLEKLVDKSIELPIQVIEDSQESVEKETLGKSVKEKSIESSIQAIQSTKDITLEPSMEVIEDVNSDILKVPSEITVEDKRKSIEAPIEIIDDEDPPKVGTGDGKKGKKCLNVECKSSLNLVKADSSMFAYYNVKKTKSNEMVCVSCQEEVYRHFEELMDTLQKGDSLLNVDFPERKEIVCIDSDEEIEEISDSDESEGVPFDTETMDLINSEINDIIEASIPISKVEEQAMQWISDLTKNAQELSDEMKEQKETLNSYQQQLDRISRNFYEEFRRPTEKLDPIEIMSEEEEEEDVVPTGVPVIPGARLSNHQEEYRHQTLIQHQSLLQRHLLSRNNTSLTPASRSIADDMIVEERRTSTSRPLNLPRLAPSGVAIQKPPITNNTELWCMRKSYDQAWGKCTVEEVMSTFDENQKSAKCYRVKWIPERKTRTVLGNVMAYTTPNEYLYRVGMRIIAVFASKSYYAGTVAEIPKETNRWRYLIFFDDGYTSYVYHEDILMICEPAEKTQDDVPSVLREFIREYLHKYPERPLVKMTPGDKMVTLYKSKWVSAKIMEVDCSLALLDFGGESDWIYRGSDRLRPLFENKVNAARRENTRRGKLVPTATGSNNYMVSLSRPKVQTARKSLSGRTSQIYYETAADKKITWTPVKVPGQVVYKFVEGVGVVQTKKFVPHTCNRNCVNWVRWNYNDIVKKINLLAIPLYTGFRRLIRTFQNTKKCIMYKAPCGRTLRSCEQLVLYLFNTRSKWTIDMFEFDHFVDCLREFTIDNANITIKDMSNGRENVPISCVNYIDTDVPKTVDYMTERKPKEGVVINTNSEFLVCCDCTDDCRNKEECACWQLTISEAKRLSSNIEPKVSTDFVGYQNRRLPEKLASGIFECNERCKCKSTCHNRVVQFPMLQKLQLFKTEMKGWGLRCLHDIPAGTFICIYVGHLLTDNDADEEGANYGDEYLADLDFIETTERYKENYESDVPEEDMIEEDDASDDEASPNSNDDNSNDKGKVNDISPNSNDDNSNDKDLAAMLNSDEDSNAIDSDAIRSRLRKRQSRKQRKRDGKRKPSSLMMTLKTVQKKQKPKKSLREYFGENESVYIMDARTSGNIGRYLNHSCAPNVYVQNVFVDTHDPRFPWISFFASKYIEAGTELTWDYSYDIGSVHDKVKYCYCGAAECRGRLL